MPRRRRLVTGQRPAEKWLAMEMVLVVVARMVQGFRAQGGGLPAAGSYVPILVTYGALSVLVLWDEAAEIAVVLGLLVLIAVLLRPEGARSTVGREVTSALAGAAERGGTAGKYAQPVQGGQG
jgi:hypothetical protein